MMDSFSRCFFSKNTDYCWFFSLETNILLNSLKYIYYKLYIDIFDGSFDLAYLTFKCIFFLKTKTNNPLMIFNLLIILVPFIYQLYHMICFKCPIDSHFNVISRMSGILVQGCFGCKS